MFEDVRAKLFDGPRHKSVLGFVYIKVDVECKTSDPAQLENKHEPNLFFLLLS